ncbi:MAG: hypothetical protein JO168_15420 [Solirubrobacterales bacterium]|nr:hypothetical protein [Solirubrobacterales bacterium]
MSWYPRAALVTSPDLASLDSVVLMLAHPSPVALATSPAVIAVPLASAARIAVLVAPDAARDVVPGTVAEGLAAAADPDPAL